MLLQEKYTREELDKFVRVARTITITFTEEPSQEVKDSLQPWYNLANVVFNYLILED